MKAVTMAKKRGKKEMSWLEVAERMLRDLKPVLDKLREYDLEGGDSDR